jgi:hypothetical protein
MPDSEPPLPRFAKPAVELEFWEKWAFALSQWKTRRERRLITTSLAK